MVARTYAVSLYAFAFDEHSWLCRSLGAGNSRRTDEAESKLRHPGAASANVRYWAGATGCCGSRLCQNARVAEAERLPRLKHRVSSGAA